MKKKVMAFLWTGNLDQAVPSWWVEFVDAGNAVVVRKGNKIWVEIKAGNLIMIVYPGQYIAKRSDGHIFAMAADGFEKFYEIIC